MRLWHIDLIPYLPRKQLISQWRELCAIVSCLHNDNLNHSLVSKIQNYDYNQFYSYTMKVIRQIYKRGYKVSSNAFNKFINHLTFIKPDYTLTNDIYKEWHNDVYLRQCLYNLEEKYSCGLITQNEWEIIYNQFKDFTPLIKEVLT